MQKLLLVIPMCLLLLASGCTGGKDEMQRELADVLNDVQDHEKEVAEYESRLSGLEKKEQILFEKTVNLSIDERELIESGGSRLQKSLEEREQLIEEEKESVMEAEETAKRLRALPEAESDSGAKAVEHLNTALTVRYELHRDVIARYKELIDSQRIVYELLIDENVKRVELEEATTAVNEKRAQLEDTIRVFNQSTNEVNTALKETQEAEPE